MVTRKLISLGVAALTLTMPASICFAAGLHGGAYGAAPVQNVVPASADLYISLDRSGGQGAALQRLWSVYQAHPRTAQALARLRAAMGPSGMQQLMAFVSAFPGQVAVAAWLPPTASSSSAQTHVAIIAQLRPASYGLAGVGNPLAGLATFSPVSTYQGTTIYRATFTGGGGSGYACVVSGDGVLASDLSTVERVIDAATFHAPALGATADFMNAAAQLPYPRALTLYLSRHYLQLAQTSGAMGAMGIAPLSAIRSAYAAAVVAEPDGLYSASSALDVPAASLYPTPNNGAAAVGDNAILYASIGNLAGMIMASGLVRSSDLAQLKSMSGIDVANDVLPLVSREVVVDVNDETSPLVMTVAGNAAKKGMGQVPNLPGSLEVASEVASPAAAQQSMTRIAAALLLLQQQQGHAPAGAEPLKAFRLPDGSQGYTITAVPLVAFTIHGRWLILSTNLAGDITAAQHPLAADPGYQSALAHVSYSGAGPLLTVQYVNIRRLAALVDALDTSLGGALTGTSSGFSVQDAEALLAPIPNSISVTRQAGPHSERTLSFLTVK